LGLGKGSKKCTIIRGGEGIRRECECGEGKHKQYNRVSGAFENIRIRAYFNAFVSAF